MTEWPVGVRFGGLGGQGLVTLGAVLAEAGAKAGLRVAASQHYGSRARGGATYSDVILSAEEIDYPHIIHPDILVVLAQQAYDLYAPTLDEQGVILADSFFTKPSAGHRVLQIPGTRTAIEEAGNQVAANFVMLGALIGFTGLLGEREIIEAVRRLVRERFREVNLKAFALGVKLGKSEGLWR
jgi:2-oxoglutarate ferredoxin oxidoreductase subunit gamma